MTTCELCGCTKEHVRAFDLNENFWDDRENNQWRCDPSCEPENEVSE